MEEPEQFKEKIKKASKTIKKHKSKIQNLRTTYNKAKKKFDRTSKIDSLLEEVEENEKSIKKETDIKVLRKKFKRMNELQKDILQELSAVQHKSKNIENQVNTMASNYEKLESGILKERRDMIIKLAKSRKGSMNPIYVYGQEPITGSMDSIFA
jgi:chromosome segregation ATPase